MREAGRGVRDGPAGGQVCRVLRFFDPPDTSERERERERHESPEKQRTFARCVRKKSGKLLSVAFSFFVFTDFFRVTSVDPTSSRVGKRTSREKSTQTSLVIFERAAAAAFRKDLTRYLFPKSAMHIDGK